MTLARTIAAIEARGHITLSEQERAVLMAGADGNEQAAKILAADAFNRADYALAEKMARVAADLHRSVENEQNLLSVLSRAGKLDDAIARAQDAASPLPDLLRASRLNELFASKGAHDAARDWGRKALALKDTEAGPSPARGAPLLHGFDPDKPAKHAICFSLFGSGARYLKGAMRNAVVARHLYPGWQARFYVDDRVPKEVQSALRAEGALVLRVNGLPVERFGLFWRFLAEDDPEVTHYIVRDADSVLNIKERVAVQQWLTSGKPFHVMRDFLSHSELILAGMWGAHRGNIGDMGKRIRAFDAAQSATLNSRVTDQQFLRQDIWPLMRDRVCCHDPVFGFGATHRVPAGYDLPGRMHIGQNHSAARGTGA